MGNARDITLDIVGHDRTRPATASAGRNLDGLAAKAEAMDRKLARSKGFERFASKAKDVAKTAGVALAAFGVFAVKAASDLEQSTGGAQAVFGTFADTVISKSKDAATAYGLSQDQYLGMSNQLGALLKNQGVAADQLAGKTGKLVSLGADLSATYGGTAATAVEALTAAYKGEFDPLEKYGITLSANAVQQELVRTGQDKLTGAALAAAKQQATTTLIYRQGAPALGQFAAQQGSTAEQAQIAQASFTNLSAQLGEKLLPVVNKVLQAGLKVIDWLQKNPAVAYAAAAGVGVLVAAWLLLNLAFLASPFGLIALGVAAIVAGIVFLANKVGGFKALWSGVWNAVVTAFQFVIGKILGFFGMIIHGAAEAFGWIPGIGGKLKAADKKFQEFRDSVNTSLEGIKDKNVHVTISAKYLGFKDNAAYQDYRAGERMSAGSSFSALEDGSGARTGGPAAARMGDVYLDGSANVYLDGTLIRSVARREVVRAGDRQAFRAKYGRR